MDRNKRLLSNLTYFVESGEFNGIPDQKGNVFVADGEVSIFDPSGQQKQGTGLSKRPVPWILAGKDKKILYITGRSGLYPAVLD